MMLSEHFSLEELTASEVAARAGIDNTPSAETMRNLLRLAAGLELVRAALGNHPIHVTSGYRSPRLNQMIGGAKNSMQTRGLAADVLCPAFGPLLQVCRGGHINLNVSQQDLMAKLGGPDSPQWQIFQKTFAAGSIWGSRTDLDSVILHADFNEKTGNFFFHFDLYDPTHDAAGFVAHSVLEVLGEHLGSPCLDP